jgi:RNA polymerase sigma factor (sigma-70 family)
MTTSESRRRRGTNFEETHWSLILRGTREGEDSVAALNHLAQCYRRPIYSFIRHRGVSPADSDDLTQSFFLQLIERKALQGVDPAKGRFRSFLLASLKNFLTNEWDKQRALKRGGGFSFVTFDPGAEAFYAECVAPPLEPEKLFDRVWALALLERALADLREDYRQERRLATFEALEPGLSATGTNVDYTELAKALGTTEVAVRMAASRMRRRFRTLLLRLVGKTVAERSDAEEELRYLFSCL